MTSTVSSPSKIPNLYQAVQLQHCFLDPANGTTAELRIPFIFYKGYVNLASLDTLGQVNVQVLNQFQAAAGSPPEITIKMWVSIEGAEFKVPLPGGLSLNAQNRLADYVITQGKTGGTFSNMASNLGSQLDNLLESCVPDNLIGDLVGGCLDKPQISLQPELIVRKDQGYLSHSVGPEYVESLVLDPSAQQLVDPEHFGESRDEMNIDFLIKEKMNLLSTTIWTTSNTVGSSIFSQIIGPMNVPINSKFTPSTIDYVASKFTHWRGGFKFIIDVVGSQFHEGVLDFVYNPGVQTTPTPYTAAVSQYVTTLIVRNGTNRFEIECPFISATPYKRVYNGGAMAIGDPTKQDFLSYYTGSCALLVSSQLKAPNNVIPTVDVNVFVMASSDFEFNTPSYYGSCLLTNPV
jgi:hypothetical protein